MMALTHELKTPIAVAKLNLETLQKRKLEVLVTLDVPLFTHQKTLVLLVTGVRYLQMMMC